jgi:hypothetical protein
MGSPSLGSCTCNALWSASIATVTRWSQVRWRRGAGALEDVDGMERSLTFGGYVSRVPGEFVSVREFLGHGRVVATS